MSRFDDFRIVRLWRGLNRTAQLALALTLVLGLNYLASQPAFIFRRDLTATHAHSLAPETLAQLREITPRMGRKTDPLPRIEIYVTLPRTVEGDSDEAKNQRRNFATINAQLDALLDAFSYESNRITGDAVKVERADLTLNANLYNELSEKLKGAFQPGRTALVVRCGERRKTIDFTDLYRIRKNLKGQTEIGIRGEEALLSAILEVTDTRKPVVYYTENHGELVPDSPNPLRSDSRFLNELKARRFDVRPLNLELANDVPSDADLIVVAGALTDFRPRETDKLRRHLRDRNGRMLALLEPGAPTGLDDLFLDWGVLAQDALVVEPNPAAKSPDGDIAVGRLPEGALHATTQILFETQLKLYAGRLRPVQADPGRPLDETLKVTEPGLFYTSDEAWGERDYRRPPFTFNADKGDLAGPLSLGVAAERAVRVKGETRIPAGRLMVIGTADMAADPRFDKGGNRYFLLNAANWLVDRNYLVNVPARPLSEFKLNATAGDLVRLARRYALVPLAVALLGFLVGWWRRRA